MPLDKQLRQLASEAPDVDPSVSLAGVVRRGRRRALAQRTAASVAGLVALSGTAVAMPSLLAPDTPRPAILHEGEQGISDKDGPDRIDGKDNLALELVDKGTAEPAPTSEPSPQPTPQPTKEPVAAPEPEPKHEPAPEPHSVEFTAHQAHDAVEGNPPTNTYWGAGSPGDAILVWSEYGAADGTVTESGEWEIHVSYAAQPPGTTKTFPVKVLNKTTETKIWFDVTSTHTGDPEHAFTAKQAHAQVEGDPPTNVYWGTAAPGHKVTIWSNHQETWTELGTTTASAQGQWEIEVSFGHLPAGTSTIQVKARNITTNEPRFFELQVTNHGGPEPIAFTATQQYGSCSDEVAWDVFAGTANPGDKIKIWSEHQAEPTYVFAGEAGGWEAKVFFPDAPRDVPFDVHVTHVATGQTVTFQFTATTPA